MRKPLVTIVLMTLALATVGCGAMKNAFTPDPDYRPTSFEKWDVGNGTGSFFRPVGPAQGTGVRHAWPE
jgi:hypothetical protein